MKSFNSTRPGPTEMLELALDLWERGLRVIPLGDPYSMIPGFVEPELPYEERLARWCKKPREGWKRWQTEEVSEEQIHRWWGRWPYANIGVITGLKGDKGIVTIDGDSAQATAWIEQNLTYTPLVAHTARGKHYIFRANQKVLVTNSSSSAKVDTRGLNGYIVAHGSTYGCGTRCRWVFNPDWESDRIDDLPEITAEDIAAINRYTLRLPVTEDGTPTVAEAVLFDMAAVRLPHDGRPELPGGRNNALASLIGQWVNDGISVQGIISKATDWNSKNPQPLPIQEIIATATSILASHVRNHGKMPETNATPKDGIRVLSLGELQDAPPALPETFWREGVLFRRSRLLIGGAPKVGKSQFVIQLALAAASGGTFLGARFEKPIKVLWLQAEIHEAFLHQRLTRAMTNMDEDSAQLARRNFLMTGRLDLDLGDPAAKELIRKIVNDVRPDILIFDPVINFSSADENDNGEVRSLLRSVDNIGEDFDCATVLVHHLRKGAQAGSFDAIRGATAFRGWFDSGFLLHQDDALTLSFELRNSANINPMLLETNPTDGSFQVCELQQSDQLTATQAEAGRGETPRAPSSSYSNINSNSKLSKEIKTIIYIIKKETRGLYSHELQKKIKDILKIDTNKIRKLVSDLKSIPQIQTQKIGKHTLFTFIETDPTPVFSDHEDDE